MSAPVPVAAAAPAFPTTGVAAQINHLYHAQIEQKNFLTSAIVTATRLRKPTRKRMWMNSHIAQAKKPRSLSLPISATAAFRPMVDLRARLHDMAHDPEHRATLVTTHGAYAAPPVRNRTFTLGRAAVAETA